MFRPLVILKKYLVTKPKWKILRIYTKQISRKKLENYLSALQEEARVDDSRKEYLNGKIDVIKALLK